MSGREKPAQGLRDLDDIDAVFTALSHPARRHVLQVLAAREGSLTAGELSARFSHAWPTTTRHLGVLRDAGLVTVERTGRNQNYSLAGNRLGDVLGLWLRSVGFELRRIDDPLGADQRRDHATRAATDGRAKSRQRTGGSE